MRRKLKLTLIALFLLAGLVALWEYETSGDSCCHVSVHAQDEGEEEPSGNPDHNPDKAHCATRPKEGGGMIACQCAKWRKCDGKTEPKSCSNFCYFSKCKCANPCV